MTLYEMTMLEQNLYEELMSTLPESATEEELIERGEILRDTMESIGADEKLEAYAKIIRQLEADEAAYKAEADRLTKKAKTAHNGIERLKNGILMYMEAGNLDKTDAGLFKLSIRKTQAIQVTDIDKVPGIYKKLKTEYSVDKMAVKEALKNGQTVEGTEVVENKSVRIS